ncbi:MAG TPA: hypothetical protein VGR15_06560 [Bacteroidota bacterium]|nr:hypothetical protein [Bacteroidota bacterium]
MHTPSPTSRVITFFATALLVFFISAASMSCKSRKEREAKQAHLDSLYRDSTNKINPYKPADGTAQYNRQREALGDINKLTTPPQPAVPARK